MKEIIEFLRYVIDPCKLKSMILVFQCFILAMLIGCRAQHSFDKERYEAEVEELASYHDAEIQELTARAESGIYATQYLSTEYESDAWVLGQWLDCLDDRYNLTVDAKAMACWVPINRAESSEYPDDLESVLKQPGQFCEFSDAAPPTEENFIIATNQLSRWRNGDIRPVPSTVVFITVSSEGVVLRDSFEETRSTGYWRA